MDPVWQKSENENGFPFYINQISKQQQWNHPKFEEIQTKINDCNYVKYAKYRMALKFRVLQRALFMESVSLNTIMGVFQRHLLGTNESSFCMESYDLEAVLYDFYYASNKLNNGKIDIDLAVELMLNFLYNIYDIERRAKIQVSSAKLALAILSDCDSSQLFQFIFTLCSDHNNCVTRLRLQSILLKFVAISIFLHEDVSFGQHLISSSIENCFINSPGLVGVTECNFSEWLEEPPQMLSWVPILYKIKTSELVVHPFKCSTCQSSPILGMRYTCIKCSKYTQCQRCFFMGEISNSHKLSHSMREYCTQETTREFSFNFIKRFFDLMQCSLKSNETKIGVVEAKSIDDQSDSYNKSIPTNKELSIMTIQSETNTPHTQLQLIIKHLESQNRELHKILLLGNHNEKEIRKYLEEHKLQVAHQIDNLKVLKEYLQIGIPSTPKSCPQSTPMVGQLQRQSRCPTIEMLSPIIDAEEQKQSDTKSQLEYTKEPSEYSVTDISNWVKNQPNSSSSKTEHTSVLQTPVREFHNDLDDALVKLQQILANNFSLDESLGSGDNNQLKYAVSEVEDMLTSFIDNVESSRSSSIKPMEGNQPDILLDK